MYFGVKWIIDEDFQTQNNSSGGHVTFVKYCSGVTLLLLLVKETVVVCDTTVLNKRKALMGLMVNF